MSGVGSNFSSKDSIARDARGRVLAAPEEASLQDLIAVLLSSGTRQTNVFDLSQSLLSRARSVQGLYQMTPEALMELRGIGRTRAAVIQAALELGRRQRSPTEQPEYYAAHIEAHWLHASLRDMARECFILISYNRQYRRIARHNLAKGNPSGVQIYVREMIKTALNDRATYLVIAHNHPEGTAVPSKPDIECMQYLDALLPDLGLELIEQFIVGEDGVYACRKSKFLIQGA